MSKLKVQHVLVAWVILGLGFVFPATKVITDPDVWMHVRTGQWILENHDVPTTDPFSFTSFGKPWVPHEWLSAIILYLVFNLFGYFGIILFISVFISAVFAGLYILVRRKLDNQLAVLLVVVVCGLAGWQFWSPRPQLFTYISLVVLLLILDRAGSGRGLWLLIPLFCLWSNLHGAWIFGVMVMGITLGGELYRALREHRLADARRIVLVAACSVSAVLIGPAPIERFTYPARYIGGALPGQASGDLELERLPYEFQSPDFTTYMAIPYEALVIGLIPVLFLAGKGMRVRDWALLLLTLHMSLSSVRHTVLFGIVVAPIIAAQIQCVLARRPQPPQRREGMEHWGLNLILLLLIPVVFWIRFPSRINDEAHTVSAEHFPIGAAKFLEDNPRIGEGRLLNIYNWGCYLIFRLYPKYLVSLDGRGDVHIEHLMRHVCALEQVSPDWKRELELASPDVIVWERSMPLATILRRSPDWEEIYTDRRSVIFARKASLHTAGPGPKKEPNGYESKL